jgi:hypothetical protein
MNHEEVQLTKGQTFKIALKAFDTAFPWKIVLYCCGMLTLNYIYVVPILMGAKVLATTDALWRFCVSFGASVGETIVAFLGIGLLSMIFSTVIDSFTKEFYNHKREKQKEVLRNIDQEILK